LNVHADIVAHVLCPFLNDFILYEKSLVFFLENDDKAVLDLRIS
jgi:hypothetical protein